MYTSDPSCRVVPYTSSQGAGSVMICGHRRDEFGTDLVPTVGFLLTLGLLVTVIVLGLLRRPGW